MNREHLQELLSCPMMSQIVINTKTSSWDNDYLLAQALKGRRTIKCLAMNGFDWENSPQGEIYWNAFDDGDVPRLRHWK